MSFNESKIDASKILFTLFGLFILAFVGVTIFNYFYSPYETEMAYEATINDTIDANAIAIRDEKVISTDKSGVAVYAVENGGKVAKGATLISYYDNAEAASLKKQIDSLSEKIEALSEINTQNNNYAADLELVSANVTSDLFTLLNCIDNDNFANADKYNDQLYYSLCMSGVTTGTIKNLTAKITDMQKQLVSLRDEYSSSSSTVISDYAGYFVNMTDGYENSVDFSKVTEMTVADFDEIKQENLGENVAGKVICDTSWYLIAKISNTDALELNTGDSVKLLLPISSNKKITATVVALNADSSNKQVLCVLNCTNMSSELAAVRNEKIQIVVDTYTGLRVNKKAVRVKDGKKGVYVMIGNTVKFREINIVYSGDEYVIVDTDNNDGQLKIYDDVIIKGKGLE